MLDEEGEDDDDEPEEDQAIKRDDLLKLIEEMPRMRGDLHVPLSNEMYAQLENLLHAEDARCKELAETYYNKARNEEGFNQNFREEAVVKSFQETLRFFKQYELIEGAARQADMFDLFIEQHMERIEQAKAFSNVSRVGQVIMESTQAIFQRFNEKNKTKSLVKEMITLQRKVDELKEDQHTTDDPTVRADIAKHLSNAENSLETTIQMLVQDVEKLQCFAYELRKQDEPDEYYTDLFLKDKVTPPLLFDLFKCNFWNEQDKRMQVKEQFKFRMLVGNDNVY